LPRLRANDTTHRVKALVVSDLHYALPQYEWLLQRAERYDLVVIAGDLLDLGSTVEPDVQILVVSKYLEALRTRTRVAVCSGNHDGDVLNAPGEFTAEWLRALAGEGLFVDGDSFDFGPDRVTICPWWETEASRENMTALLEGEVARRGGFRRWIWVHHAPPAHSPVAWNGKASSGDPVLEALIRRLEPDIVLSGHIHNAPFYSQGAWVAKLGRSLVFNAGNQIGPIPATIRLDLGGNIAVYHSLEVEESRDLGAMIRE